MKEEFIPWPNYGICSECKNKVDIPNLSKVKITDTELTPILKRIRKKGTEIITYKCPYCGNKMKHIITQHQPIIP